MKLDPIKLSVWGMIVGNIENMGIYPVLQGGEAIAKCLEGNTVVEKLAQIDGDTNMELTERNGITYIVLKVCPFSAIYKDIPAWGEKGMRLVETYNKKPDGGGALHPLCLVHKGMRNAMKAGIVSIACRSGAGKIEVAEKSLEKAKISREEAIAMVEGKGCLYSIPTDQIA